MNDDIDELAHIERKLTLKHTYLVHFEPEENHSDQGSH
jgi:hypothetical protein